MFRTITSGALHGLECYLTHVEVDTAQGLPVFDMVGYLSSEVKEARERVRVALKNTGILIPPVRITVNLSPANIRKEGPAFDLPIAIGIMSSLKILPDMCTNQIVMAGELGLDGTIRPIKGVLPIVMEASKNHYEICIIPKDNYGEGIAVDGIRIYGAGTLAEAIAYLKSDHHQKKEEECIQLKEWKTQTQRFIKHKKLPDFSQMRGQEETKRAAVIAAAGFHHLLMIGPPGAGKTMVAKRMPSILPELTKNESLEVSKIYSIAGLLDPREGLIRNRPFLNPHHTISEYAMAGGGRVPRPGVISLSHRGLLFLDELPEFKREVLEIMRQPLEDKEIHIARSSSNYIYPASFLLVAAMNPCPCGYYPDRHRCRCTPTEIKRYLSKISGPIYDRIDLCITTSAVEYSQLTSHIGSTSSEELAKIVMKARTIQMERYQGTDILFNGELNTDQVEKFCPMTTEATEILKQLFGKAMFSARSYQKIIKVARTIADLEEKEIIDIGHIAEAVMYQDEEWRNEG